MELVINNLIELNISIFFSISELMLSEISQLLLVPVFMNPSGANIKKLRGSGKGFNGDDDGDDKDDKKKKKKDEWFFSSWTTTQKVIAVVAVVTVVVVVTIVVLNHFEYIDLTPLFENKINSDVAKPEPDNNNNVTVAIDNSNVATTSVNENLVVNEQSSNLNTGPNLSTDTNVNLNTGPNLNTDTNVNLDTSSKKWGLDEMSVEDQNAFAKVIAEELRIAELEELENFFDDALLEFAQEMDNNNKK